MENKVFIQRYKPKIYDNVDGISLGVAVALSLALADYEISYEIYEKLPTWAKEQFIKSN
jgi:hypothetical protein